MSKLKFFCWLSILVLFVSGAAAAAWRFGLRGPRYTAAASLLMRRCQPSLLSRGPEKCDPTEFETFKETQMLLIKERAVLAAALRNRSLAKCPSIQREEAKHNALTWLGDHLQVEGTKKYAEIVQVSLTSDDPQEAATIVNAVVEAYMEEVVNRDNQRRRQRLSDVQSLCTDKENEVRAKRTELADLARAVGDPSEAGSSIKRQLLVERLLASQRELAWRESELLRVGGNLRIQRLLLEQLGTLEISDDEVYQHAGADPQFHAAAEQVAKLQQATLHKDTPAADAAEAARSQKELEAAQSEFKNLFERNRERCREAKRGDLQNNLRALQSEQTVLSEQREQLAKKTADLQDRAEAMMHTSIDVQMLRGEVENAERILREVTDEKEALRVELKSPPRIYVNGDPNSPAVPPESPD